MVGVDGESAYAHELACWAVIVRGLSGKIIGVRGGGWDAFISS